jgi:hypothetical protein
MSAKIPNRSTSEFRTLVLYPGRPLGVDATLPLCTTPLFPAGFCVVQRRTAPSMFVLVVLCTALAAIAAYSVLSSVRAYLRLRHIPGPLSARLSHIPLVRQMSSGNYVDSVDSCHAKYGPVVVLAPDMVSVKNPAAILQTNSVRSNWNRGTPYLCFRTSPGVDNLFSLRDKRAHERLRAKLAPGYTGRAVQGVEAMVDDHVNQLVRLLRDKSASGAIFDFSDTVQYFSLDVISCFAFGQCFKCLERDDDFHEYLTTVGKATPAMLASVVLPFFQFVMDTPALKSVMPKVGSLLHTVHHGSAWVLGSARTI